MTRLADHLLALAIHLLPQQVRRRYLAEFEADLRTLPAGNRIPYAVSTLVGAPRLRWEVLHSLAGPGAARCFLGQHHDRRVHTESADPTVYALECLTPAVASAIPSSATSAPIRAASVAPPSAACSP